MSAQPERTADAAATITCYPDGPLLVRGDFAVLTPEGRVVETRHGTVALCRCGRSGRPPFCDGTHRAVGFRCGP
ncbi:CDGSH iron-sulfur domain-containing protein [Micromonospora sp. HUAS LYJ1]|uniref:CDGSH iron-sulfur domain-containing protein n=1 Tax=Micromonospora sp. HUAS LYJ1 TaxID=3061626 RepID=UPI00267143CB|nr:CDGSH iron-sulfur domain-containing protein [Micromonospora sp. HUAS LYJ1]WKU06024.1 CDGSH iron-sulfur domain-containing protein [Micromonospora sp. HUAS LYJ1]